MKLFIFSTFLFFASNVVAGSNSTILDFGYELLQQRYSQFSNKMTQCDDLARSTVLAEDTVLQLKTLPSEAALVLAAVNHKSLQRCALYEYSEVLRTLVSIESHSELATNSRLRDEIDRIRPLLVADMSLFIEKEVTELPEEYLSQLQSIDELKSPFNLIDAVDRVWGL